MEMIELEPVTSSDALAEWTSWWWPYVFALLQTTCRVLRPCFLFEDMARAPGGRGEAWWQDPFTTCLNMTGGLHKPG